jgi:hypothetical protein
MGAPTSLSIWRRSILRDDAEACDQESYSSLWAAARIVETSEEEREGALRNRYVEALREA